MSAQQCDLCGKPVRWWQYATGGFTTLVGCVPLMHSRCQSCLCRELDAKEAKEAAEAATENPHV